jgi:hypothetical protein
VSGPLVPIAGQLELPDVFTPTGLNLPPDLPDDDWLEVGRFIAGAHTAVAWWIGDWINYGDDRGFITPEIA